MRFFVCVRVQILSKLQRRQANWKLDPPLRKACRSDVQSMCASQDAKDEETGSVYKCMVSVVSHGFIRNLCFWKYWAFMVLC